MSDSATFAKFADAVPLVALDVAVIHRYIYGAYCPMFRPIKTTSEVTRHRRQRARDFLLYVSVGFVILGVIFGAAMTGLSEDAFVKWLGLIAFTLLLFGYFIVDSRSLWRRAQFWVISGTCLLAHLVTFVVLFGHTTTFKPVWIGMIGLVEMLILLFLRRYLL